MRNNPHEEYTLYVMQSRALSMSVQDLVVMTMYCAVLALRQNYGIDEYGMVRMDISKN